MAKNFSILAYLGLKSQEFMAGLTGAQGATRTSMANMGAMVAQFGKAAALAVAVAMAAAAAAVIKFSVDSIKAFALFEKGMLEVFTLLPGISRREMGKMSQDVLDLSRKMGILTEDMVPALYQAISAGVPKSNVMEFMEVASRAAIAGVTTLETAVDGLTSVINAYGKENLSAEKAADIFFTTVRLGKTTFEELAASLYNVTPVAAAVGISFQDVGAAIAALSAQGVPTAQATTQIRSAILSLTAPSEKARDIAKMLGLSFEKLAAILAQPGGLKTAMELVMRATGGNMATLKGLMGRIEGVNGVLALSKNNFQAFTDAILAQGRAAGAHVEAFERMNQGLSRQWDLLKTNVKATMIEVGSALAPIVQEFVPLVNFLANALAKIDWKSLASGIMMWLNEVKAELRPIIDDLIVAWGELVEASGPVLESMKKLGSHEGNKLKNIILMIVQAFTTFIKVLTALFTVFEVLQTWFRGIRESNDAASKSVSTLGQIFRKLAQFIGYCLAPIGSLVRALFSVGETALKVLRFIGMLAEMLTDFINLMGTPTQQKLFSFAYVWTKIKSTILTVFTDILTGFNKMVSDVVELFVTLKDIAVFEVMEIRDRVIGFVRNIWEEFSTRFPMLADVARQAWETVREAFGAMVDFITSAAQNVWDVFEQVFPGMGATVKRVAQGMIDKFSSVFNFIKDKLGFLAKVYEKFTGEVIDLETNMAADIANIEQNAANERARFLQGKADERARKAQAMVDERTRKAKEAADLEKAIEEEKIAAITRALRSLGAYQTFLNGKSLKELEEVLEAQGEAGAKALAQTTIQNEAQLARIQKAMQSLGHELVDLKKLTGEQLREMWLAEGDAGRKAYQKQIELERQLAAEQKARADAAIDQSEEARHMRSLSYEEMVAEQKRREEMERTAEGRRKKAAAAEVKRQKAAAAAYQKQLKERAEAMQNYLFEQGSAMFKVNGMWVKANNTQEALEKSQHIMRLRRIGQLTAAKQDAATAEAGLGAGARQNARIQNKIIADQGANLTANLGSQRKISEQQNFQIGKLTTQIGMDKARVIHANNYANALARAGLALKNSERRHSNSVIMSFHMARYAALFAENLSKARPELEALAALVSGLPVTGALKVKIDVGASAGMGSMTTYLQSMDYSLKNIDNSLQGKFVNQ